MDWAELRGKLPLGKGQLPGAMPSFTGLRSGDLVYVDKTSYVQIIAERCEPQVLARPPRFGKSMLVSTSGLPHLNLRPQYRTITAT